MHGVKNVDFGVRTLNELPGTGNGMIEMNKGIEDEEYEVEYLTGENYPHLCSKCQSAIDNAHMLIVDGFASGRYVHDNEGPCMLAYDKGWFRGCECEG